MRGPEQSVFAVSRPGTGDVTDGSVDYYGMDWEIVGHPAQRAIQADPAPPCGQDGAGGPTADK